MTAIATDPAHNAILLGPRWRAMGIGVWMSTSGNLYTTENVGS